jgi:hypothetical protein
LTIDSRFHIHYSKFFQSTSAGMGK